MGPDGANTPTRDALLTPGCKARPTSGLYLSLEEEQPQQHAFKKQQGPRSWLNALCACALLLACFFVSYSIGRLAQRSALYDCVRVCVRVCVSVYVLFGVTVYVGFSPFGKGFCAVVEGLTH